MEQGSTDGSIWGAHLTDWCRQDAGFAAQSHQRQVGRGRYPARLQQRSLVLRSKVEWRPYHLWSPLPFLTLRASTTPVEAHFTSVHT